MAESDDRQEGTVVEWNERGFGFIGLEDGRRAYVHHSHFEGRNLQKGEPVTAIITEDRQNPGKWAATEVQRLSPANDVPRLDGIVEKWNERGFGFIQVADGRRAYVHASQFEGKNLEEGEGVTAVITEDAQNPGKWAASDVQRNADTVQKETPQAQSHGMMPQHQMPAEPMVHMQGQWAPAPMMMVPVHMAGGFMNHPHAGYGGPAAGCGHFGYGAAHPPQQRAHHQSPGPIGAPIGSDASCYWGSDGPIGASEDRVEGTVCEWSERGFGFIKTTDGRRVYVHHSAFGGGNLVPGVTVNAAVEQDIKNDGKWAATDVQLGLLKKKRPAPQPPLPPHYAEAWSAPPTYVPGPRDRQASGWMAPPDQGYSASHTSDSAPDQRVEGRVVQWNERGFGFIEAEDQRRAYVHSSAFGGGDLEPGELINCVLEEDAKVRGKWCAKNLQRGSLAEEGEVCKWNHQGGFGFLNMADGRRAYIHASLIGGGEKQDLEVGTRLRVRLKPDPRNTGKWCVSEIKSDLAGHTLHTDDQGGLDQAAPSSRSREPLPRAFAPGEEEDTPLSGSVSDWDQRGFGFVLLEDGRRAYVHSSTFSERGENVDLLVGENVTVTVKPDSRNRGKWQVKTITREEGAVAVAAVEAALDASEPTEKRARFR